MPDDIIISELSNAPQIDDSAVFPLTQDNGGSPATFKASMSQIAGKIGEGTTFANLQTTSKTLVGALNELKAGGGGSTELIGTASGSIATFNDGGNNIPMKSCEVDIVAQQVGTGTPSPSNPRTISGFSSVEVDVLGINLLNPNTLTANSLLRVSNGTVHTDSAYSAYSVSDYINIKGGESYFLLLDSINSNTYGHAWYDVNKNFISAIPSNDTNKNKVHTAPNNAHYLRVSVRVSDSTSVNYPSTDTTYHAYNGTTHTITLPETIYGGTAELVGGNGIKTWDYVADLSSLSWSYSSTYQLFLATISDIPVPASANGVNYDVVCSAYMTDTGKKYNDRTDKSITGPDKNFSSSHFLIIKDTNYTDATAFKNSLSGIQLIYKMETPTAFTFTGANIPTLSGVNNVYADSGDVNELEYFNENADEIAELDRAIDYHNYSTSEQIVGTWIDGSTLYEKTISTNSSSVDLTSLGISTLAKIEGVIQHTNGKVTPISYESEAADWAVPVYDVPSKILSLAGIGTSRGGTWTFTIRYTKSST